MKVGLLDYNVEWAQETKRMIDLDGGVSLNIMRAFYTHQMILVTALNRPAIGLAAALI